MELLTLAIIALVVSFVAGGMGYGRVAGGAATVSRVLFGVFFLFLLVALVLFALVVAGVSAIF